MPYIFDEDVQGYVFETGSNEATNTYVVNNIKEQYETMTSDVMVNKFFMGFLESDTKFDEIQADGKIKQVSLKGSEVVSYLNQNKQTFEEAGRNREMAAIHLESFCLKNGMTVDEMIRFAKNPDDPKNKELAEIAEKSKNEFLTTTCCKDKSMGHQLAGNFMAGYVRAYRDEMDEIRKLPQSNNKDLDHLNVLVQGQQSVLEQTVKEVNKDIFDIANTQLKSSNYPLTVENIRYCAPLCMGITQEKNQMQLGDNPTTSDVDNACRHYAVGNAITENFRNTFSADKNIDDVFKSFDENYYIQTTAEPWGPKYDTATMEGIVSIDSGLSDLVMDGMTDKEYLKNGVQDEYPMPEEKLDELLADLKASHDGSIRNRMNLTDSNRRFSSMYDAAKNLKTMMQNGASKDQMAIGYRELQTTAANYLEYKKDVDPTQKTNAGNRKRIAEECFKFGGTQKLAAQGRTQEMKKREAEIKEADRRNDPKVKKRDETLNTAIRHLNESVEKAQESMSKALDNEEMTPADRKTRLEKDLATMMTATTMKQSLENVGQKMSKDQIIDFVSKDNRMKARNDLLNDASFKELCSTLTADDYKELSENPEKLDKCVSDLQKIDTLKSAHKEQKAPAKEQQAPAKQQQGPKR